MTLKPFVLHIICFPTAAGTSEYENGKIELSLSKAEKNIRMI